MAAGDQPQAGASSNGLRTPVLVELFTAEGCSSCPPADRLLEHMVASQPASGAEIIGIGEHVDYWNQLGWEDRFSSTEFTSRQEAYMDRLGTGPAYTPMMVVDGTAQFVGSDWQTARRVIEHAATMQHGTLKITRSQTSDRTLDVTVTASNLPLGPDERADVILAIIENDLRSDVKRGENAGKILTHVAVTRSMRAIGGMTGSAGGARAELQVAPAWKRDRLKIVAFVQARKGGRVVATSLAPAFDAGAQPNKG